MSRKCAVFVVLTSLMITSAAFGSRATSLVAQRYTPVIGGHEEFVQPWIGPVEVPRSGIIRSLDDPIGEVYEAGTTYYDYQHNGTTGNMVSVDDLGWVQVIWMNGLTPVLTGPRHVYWNGWDPATQGFVEVAGRQVNSAQRAGYTAQAVTRDGWCFPVFHQISGEFDNNNHAAAAIDYYQHSGTFSIWEPNPLAETNPACSPQLYPFIQVIWPKAALTWTEDSVLHMVSTESPCTEEPGDPQKLYYSRGLPVFDEFQSGLSIEWQPVDGNLKFRELDVVMTISADVAASQDGDRVAIAWAHPIDDPLDPDVSNQINNDLFLMISEDGGWNWTDPINVTQFPEPDYDCPSGDTLACNLDTFRLYADCEVFFDRDDNIHVGFTTRTFYGVGAVDEDGTIVTGPLSWIDKSGVWHWSEIYEEFVPLAKEYYFERIDGLVSDVGAWQLNVQRPSFAEDPVTGYLYCSMMRYDSNQYSDQFWHMADAWVCVSTNVGRTWSVPVNVTATDGGDSAADGQSLSERDISLAERVTYTDGIGYLHMEYVLDRDAGSLPHDEGRPSLNPVIYQKIPVTEIPVCPTRDPFWPVLHVDSTGYPGLVIPLEVDCPEGIDDHGKPLLPRAFSLFQNYPNPFNATTAIVFELPREADVSLVVYNVMGQAVATLVNQARLQAGAYVETFDASQLSSGIYFYTLESEGVFEARKMALLK